MKSSEQHYDNLGMIKFKSDYSYNSFDQKIEKKFSDLNNNL